MKIARYRVGAAVHYGIVEGDRLHRLAGAPYGRIERTGETDALDSGQLLCPVDHPRIFGVGLNYVAHIAEVGAKTPVIPLLFMKPDNTAVGPGDAIVYPREGETVHFEAELAVVIGRGGRRIGEAEALGHVLGYTCANDVSERVIQSAEMAMGALVVSKGFDTFCPMGPFIVTDLDPADLRIGARVNGAVRQDSTTADLLFSVPYLVSYLSQALTLRPGDVIITGTPSGVGPVRPGDVVDITIEGIGTLTNPVVAER